MEQKEQKVKRERRNEDDEGTEMKMRVGHNDCVMLLVGMYDAMLLR